MTSQSDSNRKKFFEEVIFFTLVAKSQRTDLRGEIFMVFCIYAMSLLRCCCVNGDGSERQKVTISALLMHMKCVVNTAA
jgi:hypothetical protein